MEQLKKIEFFLRHSRSERGIWKTIDENRELLQCLQTNAPEALEKCPWIEGWIAGTDIFLINLMMLLGMEKQMGPYFPRPWPGALPISDAYGADIKETGEETPNSEITTPQEYKELLEHISAALLLVWAQESKKNTARFNSMNYCGKADFSFGNDDATFTVEYEIDLKIKSLHKTDSRKSD